MDFEGGEVSGGRACITRIFDEISANGVSLVFFLFFVRLAFTDKFAIGDSAVCGDL